ncbi:MAG: serine protein kinase PrkA, partial [Myxococcota bacterium]
MVDVSRELEEVSSAVLERFEAQKRVLSFREYLAMVGSHAARHTRDAARYLHDAFVHFGEYEIERPWGRATRWRLFDLPFQQQEGERSDHLVGQEALQNAVFRTLQGFRREGRANRLLLLHGPNGSAKSTFAAFLMRALVAYAETDEGALYRFSWIFPRGTDGKTLGFAT